MTETILHAFRSRQPHLSLQEQAMWMLLCGISVSDEKGTTDISLMEEVMLDSMIVSTIDDPEVSYQFLNHQ